MLWSFDLFSLTGDRKKDNKSFFKIGRQIHDSVLAIFLTQKWGNNVFLWVRTYPMEYCTG